MLNCVLLQLVYLVVDHKGEYCAQKKSKICIRFFQVSVLGPLQFLFNTRDLPTVGESMFVGLVDFSTSIVPVVSPLNRDIA